MAASGDALWQGLDVWLSPQMWNRDEEATLAYLSRAAEAAEGVRGRGPGDLVFSVGSESTLFMNGIVPGRNPSSRISGPELVAAVKAGRHNGPSTHS
jgi:hypothetical protein